MAGDKVNNPQLGIDDELEEVDTLYQPDHGEPDEELENPDELDEGTEKAGDSDVKPDESDTEHDEDFDATKDINDDDDDDDDGENIAEAASDAVYTLSDGSQLTVEELAAGNLRQGDYTRKTQEVAEMRRSVTLQAEQVESTVNALADFVAQQIPPEPHPSLMTTDPIAYNAQKAQRDAAIQRYTELVEIGTGAKEQIEEVDTDASESKQRTENASLASMFPATTNEKGRTKFFEVATKAAKEVGYTDSEIEGAVDHRLFALAYWAQKGLASRKKVRNAKAKASNAPSVAKQRMNGAGKRGNRKAMNRLAKTGSLQDAMNVDFD